MNEEQSNAQIDWIGAFKYYCELREDGTQRSYQDVADAFGVALTTVEYHGSKQNWVDSRQALGVEALEAMQEKLVEEGVNTSQRHADIWKNAQSVAQRMVQDFNEDVLKYLTIKNDPTQWETSKKGTKIVPKPPSPARYHEILKALRIAVEGERTALGLPNSYTNSKFSLDDSPSELGQEAMTVLDQMFKRQSGEDQDNAQ